MSENEPGFEIDGRRYAVPLAETITLGEERLLYLYADLTLRFLAPAPNTLEPGERHAYLLEQGRRVESPDFKRAWAIIAYRREHPEADLGEVEKLVDASNALQIELALLGDDADPPTSSQKPPESRSDGSEPKRSTASGTPSPTASETPDESPAPTGATESDTSSLASLRIA